MRSRIINKISNGFNIRDGKMTFKVRRTLGGPVGFLDPFLLLDEMKIEDPEIYKDGFPPHPHRGFMTLTYMIKGSMEHKDTKGNHGIVTPGSLQLMKAGRGIIHSEIPKPDDITGKCGLLHGYQLWLNLKSSEKMSDPTYLNISSKEIPEIYIDDCYEKKVRVIAGKFKGIEGAIKSLKTIDPLFLDIQLKSNSKISIDLPNSIYNTFIYVVNGKASFGPFENRDQIKEIQHSNIGIFNNDGDKIDVSTSSTDQVRFLLLSAKPIKEPIVLKGSFVMNTQKEIDQAYLDYENGILDK
ncbi:hypothetical protein RB653_003848 [Dictyostelium firmibasis]|uniref:Pirin family protein n=1 Tax=Dictyostelium firmibasis TaxID=79012 RepID=A0AAN7U5A4_9MYCE